MRWRVVDAKPTQVQKGKQNCVSDALTFCSNSGGVLNFLLQLFLMHKMSARFHSNPSRILLANSLAFSNPSLISSFVSLEETREGYLSSI